MRWKWGADGYLHWQPVPTPWPEPLTDSRATTIEKRVANTMLQARQRMIENWKKQKPIMEADMRKAQDEIQRWQDGDMEKAPSKKDLRDITSNVLALHDIADDRQLRNSPQRIVTTAETRGRARHEDPNAASWSQASNWMPKPDAEDPSSASDTSWKDKEKWKGHSRWREAGGTSKPPWHH